MTQKEFEALKPGDIVTYRPDHDISEIAGKKGRVVAIINYYAIRIEPINGWSYCGGRILSSGPSCLAPGVERACNRQNREQKPNKYGFVFNPK